MDIFMSVGVRELTGCAVTLCTLSTHPPQVPEGLAESQCMTYIFIARGMN